MLAKNPSLDPLHNDSAIDEPAMSSLPPSGKLVLHCVYWSVKQARCIVKDVLLNKQDVMDGIYLKEVHTHTHKHTHTQTF